ncbi:hypothetical protein Goshw_000768, partial [Gossypium schwendimanii]|nr:hypothetical protein [Gossypium schwendimanii]
KPCQKELVSLSCLAPSINWRSPRRRRSNLRCDVRDYDAVEGAVVESGPIDVLVVNQGIFVPQALEKQGLDEIKLMIDVKLMGSFNVIKAVLPLMKYRKDGAPAAMALVSSQVGQVGSSLLSTHISIFFLTLYYL